MDAQQGNSNIKFPVQSVKTPKNVLILNDNNKANTNNLIVKNDPHQAIQECSKEESAPTEQRVEVASLKHLADSPIDNYKDYENITIGNNIEDIISPNVLFGYYDLKSGIYKQTEDDVIIQVFKDLSDKQKEIIQNERQKIYALKHKNMLDIIPMNNVRKLIPYTSFKFGAHYLTLDKKTKGVPVTEREIKVYVESFIKFIGDMHKENIYPVYFRLNSTFINPTNEIKVPHCKVNSLILGNAKEFYDKICKDENKDSLDYYLPLFFIKDASKREFNKAFDLWAFGCYLFELRTAIEPWKHPLKENNSSFNNMKTFIEFMKNVKEDNPMTYYINNGGKIKFDSAFAEFLEILFDPKKQKTNVYTQLEESEYWTKYYPEPSSADSSESNFKHNLNENERVNNMLEDLGVFSVPVSDQQNQEQKHNDSNQIDSTIKNKDTKYSNEVIIVSEPNDKCPGISIITNKKINKKLGEKETKETNEKEKETNSERDKMKFDSFYNDEANNNNLALNSHKQNLNESNGIQIVDMGVESNDHCLNEVYIDNNDRDGCFLSNDNK